MSLQWIYQRRDRLHFAVFSLLGFHFLAFWPCGPSFPCILTLWAFISLHFAVFSLLGLHFLAFWPCGPSFPCILTLWAFISLHFGLLPPPTCCQKWRVCPTSLQWIDQRRDRPHFAVSSLLGLHFLAFWPCGPSFFFSFPVKPLPSANDPCLKYDFLLAHLPGMGFLPVKPLPPANDPYLKRDFLLAPLPGMDFLPAKPLPSANDLCLKWDFLLARTWDFWLRPCGRGLLPGERPLPSSNGPCMK